jgi:putative transcriptional regulator
MRAFAGLVLACLAFAAAAQQHQPANSIFLIAKPELRDPNFARSVVLVTQSEDGSTVGVIINRPSPLRLSQFLSREFPTQNYREPLFLGGPVMRQAIVALFHAEAPPAAAAFHVMKSIYLTLHHDNIVRLLKEPASRYRLYAGFSGGGPRQLESELLRHDWLVLPADEATVFRGSHDGLWEEMLERARRAGKRAGPAKNYVGHSVTAKMVYP